MSSYFMGYKYRMEGGRETDDEDKKFHEDFGACSDWFQMQVVLNIKHNSPASERDFTLGHHYHSQDDARKLSDSAWEILGEYLSRNTCINSISIQLSIDIINEMTHLVPQGWRVFVAWCLYWGSSEKLKYLFMSGNRAIDSECFEDVANALRWGYHCHLDSSWMQNW